jgi:phosphofructokinase/fructose-1,6-bisphosphatase
MTRKRIGILTGGGDVPGLNAIIKTVTYRGSEDDIEVVGLRRGWEALTHLLAWDEVRHRAQRKAIEIRGQGWSGAAMLPYSELEYGGFRDTVSALLKRYQLREGRQPKAAD